SDKYKIVIGVLDDGHQCDGGNHPKGLAVDLNGITLLSDGSSTGNEIHWQSNTQPLVKQFYTDVANILAANNAGGGLGQIQCFNAVSPPAPVAGVTFKTDACNHLHVYVNR